MKEIFRQILFLISVIFLVTLQISFLNNLNLHYLFLVLVSMLVLFNFNLAINIVFYLGIILDLFNQETFGLMTITLFLTGYFLHYLFLNYLTHKNFLTYLSLTAVGFLIFNLIFIIFNLFLSIVGQNINFLNWQKIYFLLGQFVYHLLIFCCSYFLIFMAKKFLKLKKYGERSFYY